MITNNTKLKHKIDIYKLEETVEENIYGDNNPINNTSYRLSKSVLCDIKLVNQYNQQVTSGIITKSNFRFIIRNQDLDLELTDRIKYLNVTYKIKMITPDLSSRGRLLELVVEQL